MQKLLVENSAEQITAASTRIEWGDGALVTEVQDVLKRSIPKPRLGNTSFPTSFNVQLL
jgi:hypothetical protein